MVLGFAGLLFHAFNEQEQGYRRLYGALGVALLGLGVVFRLWPVRVTEGETVTTFIGGNFLSWGAPSLLLALLFLLSFLRHETDVGLRHTISRVVAIAAGLLVGVGLVGSVMYQDFLMGPGVIHLLLGLLYGAAFVGIESPNTKRGYRAGLILGVIGVVMIVIAIGKVVPYVSQLLTWVRWQSNQPGAPFLFAYLGLEFLLLSVGICSDNQLVVLTRRELGSFFYSPIAYIVFVVLTVLGGGQFFIFVSLLAARSESANPFAPGGGVPEPIVQWFIFSLVPVVCVILLVPVITMRLLSEENRSGTLEVLLTAPVKESTIVLSKFFAGLRVFMLAWYPWALYLTALWVEGGEPFDYRPVLSFGLALLVTGAGFIAMGLFFSSLTRNQIVSAILALMGMIVLLAVYLLREFLGTAFWSSVLTYVSFLDLWLQASGGQVAPRYTLFHVSFAIFFIFLTIKVLEARKWR
jgi:ABC-type transport system involved in multi-copper enzyme maturation permease subunit